MRKIVLSLTGILILSIFVLAGCGSGPQQTSVADTGAFAVDFTKAPGHIGFIALGRSTDSINKYPEGLKDKELTIEAWVKTKYHSVNKNLGPPYVLNPYGSIFGIGSDFEGIMLWIDDDQKVSFTFVPFDENSTSGYGGEFTTTSNTVLDEPDTWYHLAAVLTSHSPGPDHPTCADKVGNPTGGEAETPHVDLYINGKIDNCGTTGANFTDKLDYVRRVCTDANDDKIPDIPCIGVKDKTKETVESIGANEVYYPFDAHGKKFKFGGSIGRSPGDWFRIARTVGGLPNYYHYSRLLPSRRFIGIIDEVRFWDVARTEVQIDSNRQKEIEPQDGLIGYWRLNQGEQGIGSGNVVIDSSGSGMGGVKMYCDKEGELISVFQDNDNTLNLRSFTLAGTGCAGPLANALPWYEGWVDLDKDLAGEENESWKN